MCQTVACGAVHDLCRVSRVQKAVETFFLVWRNDRRQRELRPLCCRATWRHGCDSCLRCDSRSSTSIAEATSVTLEVRRNDLFSPPERDSRRCGHLFDVPHAWQVPSDPERCDVGVVSAKARLETCQCSCADGWDREAYRQSHTYALERIAFPASHRNFAVREPRRAARSVVHLPCWSSPRQITDTSRRSGQVARLKTRGDSCRDRRRLQRE